MAASLSAPHGSGGPLYPGTCRKLDGAERSVRLAWEPHGWRIDMAKAAVLAGPLTWQDERAGTIMADTLGAGDLIFAREDAPTSYHLAANFDDGIGSGCGRGRAER